MSLVYQDRMVDQFRRDVVLLNLLEVKPGRNDTCTWPVKVAARTAGGPYTEGADLGANDIDSHDRLTGSLSWAQYRKGARVSGLALALAAASGSDDPMIEEIMDALDELALDIGADAYAGNHAATPPELAGAALAIDDSDDNFAGIDTGVHTEWLAGEDTLATASLSISNLRTKLHRPVRDAIGMDPEFVTCRGSVIDTLKDLFGEKADTIQEVRTNARGTVDIHAATGARAISIDGVPYIEDRHCTSGTLYAWHSKFVHIKQVPAKMPSVAQVASAMKMLTGVDVEVSDVEARLRSGAGKLVPTIEFLAQNGDAYTAQVKAYLQFCWQRRQAFSKLALT